LWGRRAVSRNKVTFVKGEWSNEELVGRKIAAQFTPVATLRAMAQARIDQIRMLAPTLAVIDPHDPKVAEAISVVGKPVSPFFESLDSDDKGNLFINGQPVIDAGDPGQISRVDSLELKLVSSGFPDLKLAVTAKAQD